MPAPPLIAKDLVGWCGIDEAGRGPLAGPVVAAAVILPPALVIEGLRDSKMLNARQRSQIAVQIKRLALGYGIGMASVAEIDHLNILQATVLAMQRALNALPQAPKHTTVDGNYRPSLCYHNIPLVVDCLVKGDQTYAAIAAASVLAKTTCDDCMAIVDKQYPDYGFSQHKGYGTKLHIKKMQTLGACVAHRKSFAPLRLWLSAAGAINQAVV